MIPEDLSATRSIKTSGRLIPIDSNEDIPSTWKGTPFEEFIGAHNFDLDIASRNEPRLLIVSCIEFRFSLKIPSGFSYVVRSAGGRLSNLPGAEFAVSYVLAKGVRHIALVGHNDCGMTKVFESKPMLIEALMEQGWEKSKAKQLIDSHASQFAIEDEIDSLKNEFFQLKDEFKNVQIAPLFASLRSKRLHYPRWYLELSQ